MNYLWSKLEQVGTYLYDTQQLLSGIVLPLLITMSHFVQQAYIKLFCKQSKFAAETFVTLCVIYGDEALELKVRSVGLLQPI